MTKHLRKNRKSISVFLLTLMIFSIISLYSGNDIASADSKISDLESKIAQLEKEQKDTDTLISSYGDKIEDEKKKQELLATQQNSAKKQAALYQEKVNIVSDEIDVTNKNIKDQIKDIDYNTELFLKRMRAMYMAPQASPLTILFGASDISDFLTKAEVLKRVSEHDTELIATLEKQKIELDKLSKSLEEKKSDLSATKEKYTAKTKLLEAKYAESKESEAELDAIKKKYVENLEKYKDDIAANEKAIEKRLEEIRLAELAAKNPSKKPEGKFAWPVPGYARISSNYGYRYIFGYKEFHYGIDIPAPVGTPVVAANSGKVIMAAYGYSYGNYVVIDHGGGYATLYAHNSAMNVSEGQIVSRGDKIASMGSTGNSTGSHSHFEVRVNGAKVNPLGYVNAPY